MPVASLCQRAGASCGACCGLYNRADFSREAVRALLSRRTRALASVPRTREAFAAAARLLAEDDAPLFPSVRVCPLLGFLGAEEARIGCLAHPRVTGGVDLRDCGTYDAGICESFVCPSHAWLTERETELVIRACEGDAWLYGLVVTDVRFLRACLEGVAAEAGAEVALRHLDDRGFRAALRRLLALKEELAPGSDGLYGMFRPGANGEPAPRVIDHEALGRERPRPSWHEVILACAGADPRSGNDLDALEELVRERLRDAAAALRVPQRGGTVETIGTPFGPTGM